MICLDYSYRIADQIATFRTIMRIADTGNRSNAFFKRNGSPPAMEPIIRELTASPTQPQVITNPMAVPVMRGNAAPVIASVVGNTGAIERPATNTSANANEALLVRSMRNVVIAIAMEAPSVTSTGGT